MNARISIETLQFFRGLVSGYPLVWPSANGNSTTFGKLPLCPSCFWYKPRYTSFSNYIRAKATSFETGVLVAGTAVNHEIAKRGEAPTPNLERTVRCGARQSDLAASVSSSASTFPPVCTCETSSRSLAVACIQPSQIIVCSVSVVDIPPLTSLTSLSCSCASCLIKHTRTKTIAQDFISYSDWPYVFQASNFKKDVCASQELPSPFHGYNLVLSLPAKASLQ